MEGANELEYILTLDLKLVHISEGDSIPRRHIDHHTDSNSPLNRKLHCPSRPIDGRGSYSIDSVLTKPTMAGTHYVAIPLSL